MRGLFFKDIDKEVTNYLALLFRVGNALEHLEEAVFCVNADHLDAHVLGEGSHYLVPFVQSQQTIVDKNTGQPISDGAMQNGGNHRRIHTTGKTQQYLLVTHLFTNRLNTVIDNAGRIPQVFAFTDIVEEALQDTLALPCMSHLRVKLQTIETTFLVRDTCQGRVIRFAYYMKSIRQRFYAIAMTHPDIQQTITFRAGVILDILQ